MADRTNEPRDFDRRVDATTDAKSVSAGPQRCQACGGTHDDNFHCSPPEPQDVRERLAKDCCDFLAVHPQHCGGMCYRRADALLRDFNVTPKHKIGGTNG